MTWNSLFLRGNNVISVTNDTMTAEMNRLLAQAKNPRGILAAGGRAVRNFLVRHFRKLDRENPNALGGARTHFWLQVGRSVQNPEITNTTATVSVSDPRYAHKVYGGTIRAKRHRNLTIPRTPEAHGKAAEVLESELGIELVAIGDVDAGQGVLAEILPNGGMRVHYVLRPSVTQDPWPGALPDADEIADDALVHMQAAAKRQMEAKP